MMKSSTSSLHESKSIPANDDYSHTTRICSESTHNAHMVFCANAIAKNDLLNNNDIKFLRVEMARKNLFGLNT